jgi:hypothetical protein
LELLIINSLPPNLFFEIFDVELPWGLKEKFEYIHIGNPIFERLGNVIKSAYQHLSPGGYLEIQDITLPIHNDSDQSPIYLREWEGYVGSGASHLCQDYLIKYEMLMREQGFKHIKSVVKKCPIGWHASDTVVGRCFLDLALNRLDPYSLVPLRKGLTRMEWQEVQLLNACARKDIKNREYHLSLNSYVIPNPTVLMSIHSHLEES